MHISKNEEEFPEPVRAYCTPSALVVEFDNGAKVENPLWWYPSILGADPVQRNNIELSPMGLHWPDLDEDISVRGIILQRKLPNAIEPPIKAAE